MYIDRQLLKEYPFRGTFYTTDIDTSLPLDERVETETIILETPCDIQETQGKLYNTLVFAVYFPFDKDKGINITRGMKFRGVAYKLVVDGKVGSIFPTQMGGCVAYILDNDI